MKSERISLIEAKERLLRLSNLADYAVVTMSAAARHCGGVRVSAAELAAGQDLRLVVYDGLRTVDAQARMLETRRVQDNPQWLEAPRLLSPPGSGAHPRGMAVDCSLETLGGALLDMGCAFDFLAADPSPAVNPAHRDYAGHSADVVRNRGILDGVMGDAAARCGVEMLGLPQEWWDFRVPRAVYEAYAPLSDADLPPKMRMCS